MFVLKNTLDWLYPRRCVLCEQTCSDSALAHICNTCEQALPHNSPACMSCALPLQGKENRQCGECIQRPPIWTSAHALWRYEDDARQLIQQYKYAKACYLDKSFSQALSLYADKRLRDQFDAVIAVPMHKRRWVSRGFNQAQILAQAVAKTLDIPLLSHDVERIKNTPRFAAGQSKTQRRQAIKGAFSVNADRFVGVDRALIVDDVKTTGATSEELAKQMLKAGVKEVSVLVLARTA